MRNLNVTDYFDADLSVTAAHFGGNALYTRNTDDGQPHGEFTSALDELDIGYIRYPAGQGDVAYIDGMVIDGSLPDHLTNFLESARAQNIKVLIVTPTHAAYRDAAEVQLFAELLVHEYSDIIHAFEIGNEYYRHQTETSYGQVANDSVVAISSALEQSGVDIPIWVQMGEASGSYSEFYSTVDNRDWLTRTVEANQKILSQLTEQARSEIDGVVEHFYLRGGDQFLPGDGANDQMLSLDYAIWNTTLEQDLSLNLTEWNIKASNLDQLGIRAASSLLAHFTNIVDLGVDEAYIWPPQLNAPTDLAGGNEVVIDSSTGIVINSVGGAIFDLMSTSLPGLEYWSATVSGHTSLVENRIFGNEEKIVVYLASRSNNIENVAFSLGDVWGQNILSSAIQVGYDPSTSNGRHYNYHTDVWDDAESIIVNGQPYYINEHDVRATVTALDVGFTTGHEDFVVELLPYEVVELVYQIPQYDVTTGSEGRDVVRTSDADDFIDLNGGDDNATSGGGADTIFGGLGDDYLNSGAGDDSVDGGSGNDLLRGWGGNDTLIGGDGDDNLKGWAGADSLVGSDGNDQIWGGNGGDILSDGSGHDYLDGGNGNDTFYLSSDVMFEQASGIGYDELANHLGDRESDGLAGYLRYSAVVEGGTGYDVLNLSGSSDAFFLHDNISGFNEGIELERDSYGKMGHVRFSSIERINLGGGDDLIDLTSPDYSLAGSNLEIYGQQGDDIIIGSDADEHIYGGSGDDTIFAGAGVDVLAGGAGADTFVFDRANAPVTVADFKVGEDILDFSGYLPGITYFLFPINGMIVNRLARFEEGDFRELRIEAEQYGNDVKIFAHFENPLFKEIDNIVTLTNTSISDLSVDNFLF